jgi:DNA-binding transcriptional MerR regulator
MTVPKLTIGQLADHVGMTPRAIRFYHSQGLLPEPGRDASGYRRYDAAAVVDLIRIKTLAEAGVPLARIGELLRATPAEFSNAVASIDKSLRDKVTELEAHRRRLAELTQGERLFLPDEIVELLDDLRAMGVSERTVTVERDGWILSIAISPGPARKWAEQKRAALADPEFRALYVECDLAFDWPPDDPRLGQLATRMAVWSAKNAGAPPSSSEEEEGEAADVSVIVQLLTADIEASSAAWRRLRGTAPGS